MALEWFGVCLDVAVVVMFSLYVWGTERRVSRMKERIEDLTHADWRRMTVGAKVRAMHEYVWVSDGENVWMGTGCDSYPDDMWWAVIDFNKPNPPSSWLTSTR